MTREIEQGSRAEQLALEHLLQKGYVFRDRNWRSGHKEIDLVMESADYIHFIEVKSLKAPFQQPPYCNVTLTKQRNIISAAKSYIYSKKITKQVQFDIVSLVFSGERIELEYIPAAFFPIY